MELMSLLAKLTLDKSQYDQGLKDAETDAKALSIATPTIPKPDNTQFKTGLDEAEETGNIFKEVMSGVWQGVKDAILVTGVVSVVSGIVGAMREGIGLAIRDGKAIKDGAKNLQISTKAYQEYEYVLGKSNLGMKDLNTAMSAFKNAIAGNATKKQAEALEALGIDAENAGEQFKSSGEMLDAVMHALAGYSENDKGAIIEALFGKNPNWTGFFDQTESEIAGLKKQADSVGRIMSDESIDNAVAFNEASEKLGDRLESIKRSFGEGIVPLLTDAVNKVVQIVDFFSGGDKTLDQQFADADKSYEATLKKIEKDSMSAEYLARTLTGMGDTSGMSATQLAKWKGAAQSLIDLIPSLADVIDLENGTINANTDQLIENIQAYAELQKGMALESTSAEKQNSIIAKQNELTEKAAEVQNKLADAYANRDDALGAFNDVLEKYGHERLGADAGTADIQNAIQNVLLKYPGGEYELSQVYNELTGASSPLTNAITAANNAQAEVDRLTEEIEKSQEAYDNWLAEQGAVSEGVQAEAGAAIEQVSALNETLNALPDEKNIHINIITDDYAPKAIGSAYIPYDNFPALLHRGEKVLTATEARKGTGDGIDYGHLEDRIAAAIRAGMEGVTVQSNLNGRDITDNVNRDTGRQLKARRFRG